MSLLRAERQNRDIFAYCLVRVAWVKGLILESGDCGEIVSPAGKKVCKPRCPYRQAGRERQRHGISGGARRRRTAAGVATSISAANRKITRHVYVGDADLILDRIDDRLRA